MPDLIISSVLSYAKKRLSSEKRSFFSNFTASLLITS